MVFGKFFQNKLLINGFIYLKEFFVRAIFDYGEVRRNTLYALNRNSNLKNCHAD